MAFKLRGILGRKRLRFSLRLIFLVTTLAAVVAGWMNYQARSYRRQWLAAEALRDAGFTISVEASEDKILRTIFGDEWGISYVALDGYPESDMSQLFNLQYLTKIAEVDLRMTRVDDISLAHIRYLRDLRVLRLSDTGITNDGLEILRHNPGIEVLSIGQYSLAPIDSLAQVDRGCLIHITHLHRLESLRLGFTISEKDLEKLGRFRSLKMLAINTTLFPEETMQFKELPALEELAVYLRDDGRIGGVEVLRNLRTLEVLGGTARDATISDIENLNKLTEVNLANSFVSDKGIKRLIKLETLRSLNLKRTWVTDEGVRSLASCRALEELSLSGTSVTDSCIASLMRMKKLRRLSIGKTGITDSGKKSLSTARPQLVIAPFHLFD